MAALRRTVLRRLVLPLATLLLLQWSAALGHCRALRAETLVAVVICMSHGDGTPALDKHGPDNGRVDADWNCPACHQLPVLAHADTPPLGACAPPPPVRAPPFA